MSENCGQVTHHNVQHYTNLLNTNHSTYKALGWGSKSSQWLRFKHLVEIADLQNQSILDVGCGLADLYTFILEQEIDLDYTGLDITPAMLESAKKKFPEQKFIQHNLLESSLESKYDYVFASGIFTHICNNAFMEKMVASMFKCCKKGLAFNTLSTYAAEKEEGELQADPMHVLGFALSLTSKVKLDHSYLPHDFTVYMYKQQEKS